MVDARRTAPPRFIPTLTDVVPAPESTAAQPRPPAREPAAAVVPSAPAIPKPAPEPVRSADGPQAPATLVAQQGKPLPDGFEEYVVHRIMQRVDLVLEQRLREAIATVVLEQTRSMVPRLHEEVEAVVRYSVCEAVAEELTGERSAE